MMGLRYCPNCKEIMETKVYPDYSHVSFQGIAVKRRKVIHRAQDNGCGHEWYTVEVPEDVLDQKIKIPPTK